VEVVVVEGATVDVVALGGDVDGAVEFGGDVVGGVAVADGVGGGVEVVVVGWQGTVDEVDVVGDVVVVVAWHGTVVVAVVGSDAPAGRSGNWAAPTARMAAATPPNNRCFTAMSPRGCACPNRPFVRPRGVCYSR
jgi:hypothetical protein